MHVRLSLADFLRHEIGLTGTHVGCEHGVCGACTVLIDGHSARSCLMLAVQASRHKITTVEGIGLVQSQAALGGSYSSAFDFPLWLFYAVAPFTFAISALRQLRRALGPEVELVAETTDGGEA